MKQLQRTQIFGVKLGLVSISKAASNLCFLLQFQLNADSYEGRHFWDKKFLAYVSLYGSRRSKQNAVFTA